MPIQTLQGRLPAAGRIRWGARAPDGRPQRLTTFRLTAAGRHHLEAAAARFGGEVRPWRGPAGDGFELRTARAELAVYLLPGDSCEQWYELWSGGGQLRRCDGVTEQRSGGPCRCAADRAGGRTEGLCTPYTRLQVLLDGLLETGPWLMVGTTARVAENVKAALAAAAPLLAAGRLAPAFLRLEERRSGANRYVVPVLDVSPTLALLAREAPELAAPGSGLDGTGDGAPAAPPGLPEPSGQDAGGAAPPATVLGRPAADPAEPPPPPPTAARRAQPEPGVGRRRDGAPARGLTDPGRAHDYGEERRAVRRHLQVLGFPAPEREVYAALLTALRRPTLAAYFARGGTVAGACRALEALRAALDAGLTLAQAAAEQAAYGEHVEAAAVARHEAGRRARPAGTAAGPGRR